MRKAHQRLLSGPPPVFLDRAFELIRRRRAHTIRHLLLHHQRQFTNHRHLHVRRRRAQLGHRRTRPQHFTRLPRRHHQVPRPKQLSGRPVQPHLTRRSPRTSLGQHAVRTARATTNRFTRYSAVNTLNRRHNIRASLTRLISRRHPTFIHQTLHRRLLSRTNLTNTR